MVYLSILKKGEFMRYGYGRYGRKVLNGTLGTPLNDAGGCSPLVGLVVFFILLKVLMG